MTTATVRAARVSPRSSATSGRGQRRKGSQREREAMGAELKPARATARHNASTPMARTEPTPQVAAQWLGSRGWSALPFQQEVWSAIAQGRSGLLHATTGSGKTYAVWLGMLQRLLAMHPPR